MNRFLYASLVLLVSTSVAQAAWRPALPTSTHARAHLDASSTDRWHYLAPGDTMLFELEAPNGGDARIRTRPVFRGKADPSFRYGFAFDDATPRRLKRLTRATELVAVKATPRSPLRLPIGGQALMGRVNRFETEVPVATRQMTLFSRDENPILVRVHFTDDVLPWIPGAKVALAGSKRSPHRTDAFAFLGTGGVNTNAYRAAEGSPTIAVGFWPVAGEFDYRYRPRGPFRFDATLAFDGTFYENRVLNELKPSLSLQESWYLGERRQWRASLEQEISYHDETFVGRGQAEEFETTAQDLGPISLGNRFDKLELKAGLKLANQLTETTQLELRALVNDGNFIHDYENTTDVYSLDRRIYEGELIARHRFNKAWRLRASVSTSLKDYREKFSRDATGAELPNEPASYLRREAQLTLQRTPTLGLRWRGSVSVGQSEDQAQGYWDYDRLGLETSLGWRTGKWSLATGFERDWLRYANAHVDHDPTAPLRAKDPQQWFLEGIYSLRAQVDLFARYQFDDREYNALEYSYEQSLATLGIVLRR